MPLMLHTTLSPAAVADALRKNGDPQKWTLFSLSDYPGDFPIVEEITEKGFRLQRRRIWRNDHFMTGDAWMGIVVFPAMILWGFLLPRIGRLFGQGDEDFLPDFVQRMLVARLEVADSFR